MEDGPVAAVQEGKLVLATLKISALNEKEINLLALVDTGSPMSFIKFKTFKKIKNRFKLKIIFANRKLKNLNDKLLDIVGTVEINVTLEPLRDVVFSVLLILKNTTLETDMILNREFLLQNKFTLVYMPLRNNLAEQICLRVTALCRG